MTLVDGKLITITPHVTMRKAQLQAFPVNRLPLYFPIPPTSDIVYDSEPSHSEKNVINRGLVSMFGGAGLQTVTWEGELLIKAWYGEDFAKYPGYVIYPPAGHTIHDANEYHRIFSALRDKGIPVQLKIQDRNTHEIECDLPVTIRKFTFTEKVAEPDTRFYSITFSQFKWLRVRKVSRTGATAGNVGPTPPPVAAQFLPPRFKTDKAYTIKALAQRAFHDPAKWQLIVKANGGADRMIKDKKMERVNNPTPKSGPYKVPKGVTILIPDVFTGDVVG